MPLVLKLCNLGAVLVSVGVNFVRRGERNAEGKSGVGRIAEAYDHVAVPKGPAFAIWGLIFLWNLVFAFVQLFTDMFDHTFGYSFCAWFCLGQLAQGIWNPIFQATDVTKNDKGGDVYLWVANAMLLAMPIAFMQCCKGLAALEPGSTAYWVSYGITINAAWILLAAGLTVSLSARAAGLKGAPLSAVAIIVLVGTIVLELYITGFFGRDPYGSPTAFLTVGAWALFWVFMHLKGYPAKESDNDDQPSASLVHAQRILFLYGSDFVIFYKWTSLVALGLFVVLEVLLCIRK